MEIIEIDDLSAPELAVYTRLNEVQLKQYEQQRDGIFIAESPLVIARALDAGYRPLSCLCEHRHTTGATRALLERCDVPVYTAPLDELTKLTGFKLTRGMLCAMARRPLPPLDTVCAGARHIAVLEDVVNPTNIGAIFRSAAALNVDAVVMTSDCCDPLYRRAVRVSMGTVFQLPWTVLPPDTPWMDLLHEKGFSCVAFALRDDSLSIRNPVLRRAERLAVVLGSEGYGLTDETIASCDYTVKIPMSHGVDSLNVAAASAVAFWQLCSDETE